jgi:hypothetical protein
LTKEEKNRHRVLETATCISGKEKIYLFDHFSDLCDAFYL